MRIPVARRLTSFVTWLALLSERARQQEVVPYKAMSIMSMRIPAVWIVSSKMRLIRC